MIVANFTKLFSIEFLHDYYRNSEDLMHAMTIVADEKTGPAMNGYKLINKFDENFLYCFVQTIASIDLSGGSINVITENKPLIHFDENTVLNFKMTLKSPEFFNHTNLRRFETHNKIFSFGNDSGNKHNSLFFLSKKIPAYNAANDYLIGMLVTDAVDHTFEAIKESSAVDPHGTAESDFWSDITDFVQYVNQEDLVADTNGDKSFGVLKISFNKELQNDFSLLLKSNDPGLDNTILGKDYVIHFKINAVN